jgi:hypothetical protein
VTVKRLLLLAALAGCPTAQVGTIDLRLTTAPNSTLLDNVTKLRITLTAPRQVVEAERGPDGFALALEVEATGESGAIVVEGFDAIGTVIAGGESPPFPVTALDARIVVYMSTPLAIEHAPVTLTARSNVAGDTLPYGAIFAGGKDVATGTASDAIAIYNAYDHSLVGGKPLLAPRDGLVVATGSNGIVHLFGGRDAAGNPTGTYWQFDTAFPPNGAYANLGDFVGLARADEAAISIAADKFVITGTPPVDIQGPNVAPRSDVSGFAPTAGSFVAATGARTALGLDTAGRLVRYHDNAFEPLAQSRPGGAVATLPDGRFIVAGGGTAEEANDILVVDTSGTVSTLVDVLAAPTMNAHVAATRRHVVITSPGNRVEIFDAQTLAPVITHDALDALPFALPNSQVLLVDRSSGDLYLFTPPPGV